MTPKRATVVLTAVAVAVACAALATAAVADETPTTSLLSRSASGGYPNAPASQAAISHDNRIASVAAYTSAATDVVPGTAPGVANIFLVARAQPYGDNGTSWQPGPTALATPGLGGRPANGPSAAPALDGSSRTPPTCLAFVSAASNLVSGDTNGQPDAFIRDLRTGAIRRVSLNAAGRQADGPTTEVAVDGRCTRVAFVARATNLALTRRTTRSSVGAVTARPAPGTPQVYLRFIGGSSHFDAAVGGLTFLASASDARQPANAGAQGVAISRNGQVLTFASAASNLTAAGSAGHSQVFVRTIAKRLGKRVHGRSVQTFVAHTVLVTRNPGGGPASGDSDAPAIDATGTHVAVQTRAPDLLAGDTHGVTQIALATLAGDAVAQRWVSQTASGELARSDSLHPALTDGGTTVFYDTADSALKSPDDPTHGRAVVLGHGVTVNRDSSNACVEGNASTPSVSPHENYVLFSSTNPLLDRARAATLGPGLLGDPAALAAFEADPAHTQVYLRYLGPK